MASMLPYCDSVSGALRTGKTFHSLARLWTMGCVRCPQVWHQAVQYLDPLPCHGQGQVLRLEATHNATRIRFRVLSLTPETSEADVKGTSTYALPSLVRLV